jgi:hypothetical protein
MPKNKSPESQRRANQKCKAVNDQPIRWHSRKRTTAKSRDGRTRSQTTGDRSEATSFKINYAEEFDSGSVEEVSRSHVKVEREEQSDDGLAPAYKQPVVIIPANPPTHTTPPPAVVTPQRAAIRDETDPENVLVTILSQASWDNRMTEMTVNTLFERAKSCAGVGHLFDPEFLDRLFRRLDSAGIDAECRSQVVTLFQRTLETSLSQWSALVDRIGNMVFANILPSSLGTEAGTSTSLSMLITPDHSRLLDLDNTAVVARTPSARERSTSASNGRVLWNASEGNQNESDSSTIGLDNMTTIAAESPLAASSSHASMFPCGERAVNNTRIYGKVCPKAPLDVFARAVIAGWAAAPSPNDAPTKIREYAKPTWRGSVTWDQKDEWYEIYEARKDFLTDVTATGFALLLSQDLLCKVIPHDRLAAARLLCQKYQQGKCPAAISSAGDPDEVTTMPLSPDAEPVEQTPVAKHPIHREPVSTERVSGIYHLLERPLTIHQLTMSEEYFEDFPNMEQATCDTPTSQACLAPSAAQKQNVYTCVFVVNTPDVRAASVITETEVQAACVRAKMPGLKHVRQESFNVFVAYFKGFANADNARRRARLLDFHMPSTKKARTSHLYVTAESHWHEINRIFIYDVNVKSVKPHTVAQHVFRALEGPLASCFRLFKQEYREHNGRRQRTRYLLRPSEASSMSPIERFYIPLDAPAGKGHVWGIFKPVNRHWKCPACHERCQGGDVSACEIAVGSH